MLSVSPTGPARLRDRRLTVAEGAPGVSRQDFVDGVDRGIELVVAGVEMGREPDAGAGAVVAEDIERLQPLRDLVAVFDVERDGSTTTLGRARRRAAVAPLVRQLEQPRRLAERLGADRRDPRAPDDGQTRPRREEGRHVG